MTKTLLGLLSVALFGITAINAASPCTLTSPPNTVTATTPNQQATFTGGVYTCTFTIPSVDSLSTATVSIDDGYLQGTGSQTNTVQFSYSLSGFAGTTGLTTTVTGYATGNTSGVSDDAGGVKAQNPSNGDCTTVSDVATACTTSAMTGGVTGGGVTTYTFTVTGSSTWLAGGLQNGGSDAFSVFVADTYSAPAPEPGTLLLIGGGLIGLAVAGRRKLRA